MGVENEVSSLQCHVLLQFFMVWTCLWSKEPTNQLHQRFQRLDKKFVFHLWIDTDLLRVSLCDNH